MTAASYSPTPFPDVNAALSLVLAGVREVLGDRLVGLYLHGSLALGDFEPLRSDIDFVAVTEDALPEDTVQALRAMHAKITASGLEWAGKLEGSYIPRAAIRRYDPENALHPALRVDGSFDIDYHGSDADLQRHVLREKGITLFGPPAHTLVEPVESDTLRRAALGILREWWVPQIGEPFRLYSREYQAYAVLTMCRILYTVRQGDVVSKPAAARWMLAETGERWADLIDRALAWPREPQPDRLAETIAMIRCTTELN
jgi:hypothetical protein